MYDIEWVGRGQKKKERRMHQMDKLMHMWTRRNAYDGIILIN